MRNLESQTTHTLEHYARLLDMMVQVNNYILKTATDCDKRLSLIFENKGLRARQTDVFEVLVTRQENETDNLIETLDLCKVKLSSSL